MRDTIPRTFTALTTVDRGYPSLDQIALQQGTQASVYDDPDHGVALRYQLDSQENESGVYGGTVVVTGMFAATLLAIFLIPLLFVLVERLSGHRSAAHGQAPGLVPGEGAH